MLVFLCLHDRYLALPPRALAAAELLFLNLVVSMGCLAGGGCLNLEHPRRSKVEGGAGDALAKSLAAGAAVWRPPEPHRRAESKARKMNGGG